MTSYHFSTTKTFKERLALALTVLLLGGALVERWMLAAPASATSYHESIRAAGVATPLQFGHWKGKEVPIPPAAMQMLRPNLIISREFSNESTGRQASFLLIQCNDTRELVAHYPPVCYPGRGYSLFAAQPQKTQIGDTTADWTEYEFVQQTIKQFSSTVVAHFIIMPNGSLCHDMNAMRTSAARVTDRFYGAAQVQVVMSGLIPANEREDIVRDLVRAHLPLIDVIRSGVVH